MDAFFARQEVLAVSEGIAQRSGEMRGRLAVCRLVRQTKMYIAAKTKRTASRG